MARPKKDFPERKAHVSGQDRVYLDGRYHYLGPSDSAEAIARYDALILKYLSNGRKLPEDEPTNLGEHLITVAAVTAEYRRLIEQRPKQLSRYRHLCRLLEDEYGDIPAEQFGPVKLAQLRELFVANGNARETVNEYTRVIQRMFKHAASRELVPLSVFSLLDTLAPLRQGQTTAREYEKRKPAIIEHVRAAAEKLSPQARAIIAVQVSTGMRPSEVFAIRPMDIDRSKEDWFYRPDHHKTEHYGIEKAVPIIGAARSAIEPFLDRPADQFCFSPAESAQWHRDQRSARRKTPKSCGNRVGTNRKKNPKRKPGNKFKKDSLNNAVRVACKKAGVPKWCPYQLRHTAATAVADALGLYGATALLGHAGEAMTKRYVHQKQNEADALRAAQVAPSIG